MAWFPDLRFCPVRSLDFPETPSSSNGPLCLRVAAFNLQSLPWYPRYPAASPYDFTKAPILQMTSSPETQRGQMGLGVPRAARVALMEGLLREE